MTQGTKLNTEKRAAVNCWLTDMDGVLVHEQQPIPGASELLNHWRETGQEYLVLTNNSIFTARDLSARLLASGIEVPEDRIWTSALATAAFLKAQAPGGSAFAIGEADLLNIPKKITLKTALKTGEAKSASRGSENRDIP